MSLTPQQCYCRCNNIAPQNNNHLTIKFYIRGINSRFMSLQMTNFLYTFFSLENTEKTQLLKLQLSTCPSIYTVYFGIWNVSSLESCSKLIKRCQEQHQLILLQLPFLLNLDRIVAISSLYELCLESWKDQTCSKSEFKRPLQYSICHAALGSSLPIILSGQSGSCHWFCALVWRLSRVVYQEAVATFLLECCSFLSINFGYSSDPLQGVNISSICPFRVEEWNTGAVCGAHLGQAKNPPEYSLDNVLVSLLVVFNGFHALYWCFIATFKVLI